jgi:hypothetical protein
MARRSLAATPISLTLRCRKDTLNGEGRRRTKVIPRFPTERSCLSLLFATLMTVLSMARGSHDRDDRETAGSTEGREDNQRGLRGGWVRVEVTGASDNYFCRKGFT